MFKRSRLVYALLVAGWMVVMAWQTAEYMRVRESARAALIDRSRDITSTLGLVIRSQRRFGGMVAQERLESALKELVKGGELSAVALLNAAGEVVASAGAPIDFETKAMLRTGQHWGSRNVILANPVDLGASLTSDTNRPTIVISRQDFTNGPGFPPRERPPPPPDAESRSVSDPDRPTPDFPNPTNLDRPRGGPPRFPPPFRFDDPRYKSLLERRGLHGLVIALSTDAFRRACQHDLWTRAVVALFATVSAAGLGLAWRNIGKSSDLQLRLLRASEMNSHLRQMNVAVAGLAHETRNPLNIIRGLAQMISKEAEVSPEVRGRTRAIIDETDRITAQLNEFINYSRPREVRRFPVALDAVIGEVTRALNYDLEEKRLSLQLENTGLIVEADEQMLRQALFNLLLNAIQAVDPETSIRIVAARDSATEASLEVRDQGPGVQTEHRPEIFKPYFTTHEKGTGLGLAVVQQIVLAHGWEIECLPQVPHGAIFRIQHIRLAPGNPAHAA